MGRGKIAWLVAGTLTVYGLFWFFTRPADYVNGVFQWMHPGAQALAAVAPIGTLVAVGTASFLAYRTLRYRTRVDDADQWWKRAQYGIDLVHGTAAQKAAGSDLIKTLLGPWLKNAEDGAPVKKARKARKRAGAYGWRVSEDEKEMLNRILQRALEGSAPDSLTDKELEELEAKEKEGKRSCAAQLENADPSDATIETSTAKNKTSQPNHGSGRRMSMGEEVADEPKKEGDGYGYSADDQGSRG